MLLFVWLTTVISEKSVYETLGLKTQALCIGLEIFLKFTVDWNIKKYLYETSLKNYYKYSSSYGFYKPENNG